LTFVYLAGNGEIHLEPGEMLALYVLEVKVVCGVVTRSSNGVILASGAAESANIVTYALMAFLKVDILVPARSDPGVPFPVHSRLERRKVGELHEEGASRDFTHNLTLGFSYRMEI
jgi:hypothetical protein